MNLKLFIARHYLFAKKSHNVINIVSAISVVSIAVGAAALILILSIFNGFNALVEDSLSSFEPDILVKPANGKFFTPDSLHWHPICEMEQIKTVSSVIEDNAFINYEGRQGTARVKGVDDIFEEELSLPFHQGETSFAAVGEGLAAIMGINPQFTSFIDLYYPRQNAPVSLMNPSGVLESISIRPGCKLRINSDVDSDLIIIPRKEMLKLCGRDYEDVTSVEIRFNERISAKEQHKVQKEISKILGEDFMVLDRKQQNPALYKMFRYEKTAVFGIMLLIVLVLCLGVFGSLRMLIIEKSNDIYILGAMGADKKFIRNSFTLEGWLVIMLGGFSGIIIGIILALLQQHFGIIKMPGSYIIDAYPVILKFSDCLLAVLGVSALGYLTARAASRRF